MTRADDCIVSNPILAAAPGCVVALTVAAVFFIGNALRDPLDVR
jgi:ABC-type dipeptide/oligopeptide/nickel transport system permease subunit